MVYVHNLAWLLIAFTPLLLDEPVLAARYHIESRTWLGQPTAIAHLTQQSFHSISHLFLRPFQHNGLKQGSLIANSMYRKSLVQLAWSRSCGNLRFWQFCYCFWTLSTFSELVEPTLPYPHTYVVR